MSSVLRVTPAQESVDESGLTFETD